VLWRTPLLRKSYVCLQKVLDKSGIKTRESFKVQIPFSGLLSKLYFFVYSLILLILESTILKFHALAALEKRESIRLNYAYKSENLSSKYHLRPRHIQ